MAIEWHPIGCATSSPKACLVKKKTNMLQFIWENKEWIFSGIGATILAGIFALFLSRKKDPPTIPSTITNNIIVNSGTSSTTSVLPPPAIDAAPFKPSSTPPISRIKFDEIRKALDEARPLQVDDVRKHYVGLYVRWNVFLNSGSQLEENRMRLHLFIDEPNSHKYLDCVVNPKEYKWLNVLPKNTALRIQGEIESVYYHETVLKNVQITMPDPET